MDEMVYIGVGSNLGDKEANCHEAMARCGKIPGCAILGRSSLYLTEPQGSLDQDWFLNGILCLGVKGLTARELLARLLGIETSLGRKRTLPWGPRIIDLDLLLFGTLVVEEEGLCLPHPRIHERRFVLVPLVELAPHLLHPTLGRTMGDLLASCPEEGQKIIPWQKAL